MRWPKATSSSSLSMKLETAIKAPRDGVIAEIAFAKGQSFDRDAILVRLEAQD